MTESVDTEKLSEDTAVLQEALKRFQLAQDAEADNRELAEDDLRVLYESSWSTEEIQDRQNEIENRPCLSFPKLNKIVQKTANQFRLNNPDPKISPEDDEADPNTALKIKGLIKQILKNSDADTVLAQACENQLENAFGYIRIITEREDDESFDQRILLDYISNPFSVYVDPASKHITGNDIEYFFITDDMARSEFEKTWPNAIASSFSSESRGDPINNWISEDVVRVAEYYRLLKTPDTLIEGVDSDDKVVKGFKSDFTEEAFNDLTITREMPTIKRTWEWRKITATDVLENEEIATKRCPLIPVYGRIRIIRNRKRLMSLIRYAKDAQKMYDYWQSSAAEKLGQSQKASYVGYKGQFNSDPGWQTANTDPAPYLEADPVIIGGALAPLPRKEMAPEPPIGYISAAQGANQDIKEIIGVDEGLNNDRVGPNNASVQANVLSGKALGLLNQNGELATFDFIDNVHKAVRQAYKVIIDMIPNYYNEARAERILGDDGKDEKVFFNTQTADGKLYDLTVGRYDVDIDVGPDFMTQREEAAKYMLEFARSFPNKADLISDIVASNSNVKDSDKMANRIKKSQPQEILDLEDTDKDENQLNVELAQTKQQLQGVTQQLETALELIQSQQMETNRVVIKEEGALEREKLKSATTLQKQYIDSEGEVKEQTIQAQAQLITALIDKLGGIEALKQSTNARESLTGPPAGIAE